MSANAAATKKRPVRGTRQMIEASLRYRSIASVVETHAIAISISAAASRAPATLAIE
jgi:hypothetical protein